MVHGQTMGCGDRKDTRTVSLNAIEHIGLVKRNEAFLGENVGKNMSRKFILGAGTRLKKIGER